MLVSVFFNISPDMPFALRNRIVLEIFRELKSINSMYIYTYTYTYLEREMKACRESDGSLGLSGS